MMRGGELKNVYQSDSFQASKPRAYLLKYLKDILI